MLDAPSPRRYRSAMRRVTPAEIAVKKSGDQMRSIMLTGAIDAKDKFISLAKEVVPKV